MYPHRLEVPITKTGLSLGLGVFMALGCSGLMGYGTELSDTQIQSTTPFSLNYLSIKPEPHHLWLDYDISHSGQVTSTGRSNIKRTYLVTGPINASMSGTSVGSWTMKLSENGSPVAGGRFTLNSSKTQSGGQGRVSETIYLVELPALPIGTSVSISGTFTAAPGTTINQMRLVVTD